ncbi:MAG TPA: DUF6401 family natural product biosynthesis protein [Trebonia sp.]|nr:DUF6401 family natural product biosynthesis protein [Trebonia sp.]
MSEMVLRLAGEAGRVSLALTAHSPGARASVDQHAAEIKGALASCGRPVTTATLLSYAEGFTEAAIARGWWPPCRPLDQPVAVLDGSLTAAGSQGSDGASRPGAAASLPPSPRPELDWESLRLAAICRLLIEAQDLGTTGH